MKFEYLLFNILILLGPFTSKLLVRSMIFPSVKNVLKAIFPVALIFILWDFFVTDFFWSFNKSYILGLIVGKLPVEEIMFFFTVPYACLILWVNIKNRIKQKREIIPRLFIYLLSVIFFTLGVYSLLSNLWYTGIVSFIFSYILIVVKPFISSKLGVLFSLSIIGLTFIFNLYLTARPVVLYYAQYKTNLNILTVPIEDFIYGLTLLLPIIYRYEKGRYKSNSATFVQVNSSNTTI